MTDGFAIQYPDKMIFGGENRRFPTLAKAIKSAECTLRDHAITRHFDHVHILDSSGDVVGTVRLGVKWEPEQTCPECYGQETAEPTDHTPCQACGGYLGGSAEPTDYEALRRILAPVVKIEERHPEVGIIRTRFPRGDYLNFCCGPNGRLNMVVIQSPGLLSSTTSQ